MQELPNAQYIRGLEPLRSSPAGSMDAACVCFCPLASALSGATLSDIGAASFNDVVPCFAERSGQSGGKQQANVQEWKGLGDLPVSAASMLSHAPRSSSD